MSRIKDLLEQQKQDFEDLEEARNNPDVPKLNFDEVVIDEVTEFVEGSTERGVAALPSFDHLAHVVLKKDGDLVALLITDWEQFKDAVGKFNDFIEDIEKDSETP